MANIVDKLLLNKIRHSLNSFVQRAIQHHPIHNEIDQLKQQLSTHHELIYQLLPDTFPLDDKTNRVITNWCERHHLPTDFQREISRNDLMFHAEIKHSPHGLQHAYLQYFKGGFFGYELVKTFYEQQLGTDYQVQAVLDFASGYGRIGRMMELLFAPEKIWVSDVREQGVAYQKQQFGFQGFPSGFVPAEVDFPTQFDLIFVGSLFTHLNEKLFGEWLQRLAEQLTDQGILIFTTHDSTKDDFRYRITSEETSFDFVEDTIEDGNVYGTSYVSEQKVRDIAQKVGLPADEKHLKRYPESFGTIQDTYVFSHDTLQLPKPQQLTFTNFYSLT